MGFDIECIIDLHTYPGEYFCPVCRTLVYPNEAFQTPCTHLYCKPCLLHIANGSRACPYDGYLVTESDSKMLMESDKVLAEKIGKVRVHCLYLRSGCHWDGALSDSLSHCSLCVFGNSPVLCNRCGVQVVHRQVHEHAQFCPGTKVTQHLVGVVSSLTTFGATTGGVNQTPDQSAAVNPVSQNVHGASATPLSAQHSDMTVKKNYHGQSVAPLLTNDQWYQQQYQQYYAQYAGIDLYRQSSQQSGTMQHPTIQQYPQNPVQVLVQQPSDLYARPQLQSQDQMQFQLPEHPSPGQQPSQQLLRPGPLLQQLPQAVPQSQVPTQGLVHGHASVQAVMQPPVRPSVQSAPQTLALVSQSAQQVPLPQQVDMKAQQSLVTQYQQAHLPVQHTGASQVHLQPHHLPAESSEHHIQLLPQQPYGLQTQPPSFLQAVQLVAPAVIPWASQPPVPPATSHYFYQQNQAAQKFQPQSLQMQLYQPTVALKPVQTQAPLVPTPHGPASLPQGQLSILPPQNHVPGVAQSQHQQFQALIRQPTVQPVLQQHPVTSFGFQVNQQGYIPQKNSTHLRFCPSGPLQHQQSQNFTSRPMVPGQEINQQSYSYHSGGSGPVAVQGNVNQNNPNSPAIVEDASLQGPDLLKRSFQKGHGGEAIEVVEGDVLTAGDAASNVMHKSTAKNEENGLKEDPCSFLHSDLQQVDLRNMRPSSMIIAGPSSTKDDPEKSYFNVDADLVMQQYRGASEQNFEPQLQGQPLLSQGAKGSGNLHHPSSSVKRREGSISGHPGSAVGSIESQASCQGLGSSAVADPHGIKERVTSIRYEGQFDSQHAGICDLALPRQSGFGDGTLIRKDHPCDPSIMSRKEGSTPDSSSFGSQDNKEKALPREHPPREYARSTDIGVASEFLDKSSQGPNGNVGKLGPKAPASHTRLLKNLPSSGVVHAGAENLYQDMKRVIHQSPRRNYMDLSSHEFCGPSSAFDDMNSREWLRFCEGSRPFDHGSLPLLSGHMRRDHMDGPGCRNGFEHMAPGFLRTQPGNHRIFGSDRAENLMTGNFSGTVYRRGDFNIGETDGLGLVSGYGHPVEFSRPLSFPSFPHCEPARGAIPFPLFGEPAMMGNSVPGVGSFAYRKRKPASSGWCRICEVDCETVEGLELHSQRREHQQMAMDMVAKIKLQNKRSRKLGTLGHGSKH